MGKISLKASVAVLAGLLFSTFSEVYAADFPFSDVATSDPIYSDLKKLYERGVVDAPADGKFRPEALMDRDEFVSIAVGVGCRKCLTPTLDDVLRYRQIPFLDFERKSPFFYCVSYAKEKEIVVGYAIPGASSYTCQDGKSWDGVPFCAKNRTSRIEAAAMLLRQAGLWNDALNASNFERKRVFKDVDPYWYGYAQKGADVGILVPAADGTLRPGEYVTKREFVRMAAIIFSLNMCEMKGMGDGDGTGIGVPDSGNSGTGSSAGFQANGKDAFPSEIRVLDPSASCSPTAPSSKMSDPNAAKYNFFGRPDVDGATYRWEFLPADSSGTPVRAEGKCLPGFSLPAGRWIARLVVTDPQGRTSVSYAEVPFGPSSSIPLSVVASAAPLESPAAKDIGFGSDVSGGKGPYSYRWDFGDGTVSTYSDPKHAYALPGTYPVTLVVVDADGNRAISKVVVSVSENADLDGDGILNSEDSCPLVYGTKGNRGCPDVSEYAGTGSAVSGSSAGFGLGATLTLAGVGGRCLYDYAAPKGAIFGAAVCDACPCAQTLDFAAQLRRCDIVFPSILSPDKKNVYSRGALFELK